MQFDQDGAIHEQLVSPDGTPERDSDGNYLFVDLESMYLISKWGTWLIT